MTAKFATVLITAAAALSLGACASRPKAAAPTVPPAASAPAETAAPAPVPAMGAVVPGSQEDLAANAGERVYFALDSDLLDAEARSVLQLQAAWLQRNPTVRARIEGNADERGTREYNLALGARRAQAARQFLIRSGVDSTRLETISYGKERPIDPGSTEEAWARNRNARTVVIGLGER